MGRVVNLPERVERWLAVAAPAVMVLAPLVLIALFVHGYVSRQAGADKTEALVKGSTLPGLPGVDFTASPRTLILALNVDCGFCTRSIPFYLRLLEASERNGSEVQIVSLFPNQKSEVSDYARRHGLACRSVHEFDVSLLGIDGTPTILLVDREGQVLDLWQGLLTEGEEAEVLSAVGTH